MVHARVERQMSRKHVKNPSEFHEAIDILRSFIIVIDSTDDVDPGLIPIVWSLEYHRV